MTPGLARAGAEFGVFAFWADVLRIGVVCLTVVVTFLAVTGVRVSFGVFETFRLPGVGVLFVLDFLFAGVLTIIGSGSEHKQTDESSHSHLSDGGVGAMVQRQECGVCCGSC